MKKKIIMFAVLLSLLVGIVPPGSARAEVIYSFTEWCADNGYSINYTVVDNYRYVVYDSGSTVYCIGVHKDSKVYYSDNGIYYSGWFDRLELDNDTNTFKLKVSSNTSSGSAMCYSILYTGRDIYDKTEVDKIVYAPTVKSYTFGKWCADAGLNCEFVDVEGQSVEYTSEDMYVVRRGASTDNGYSYYLTRVNIVRDGLCFPTLSNGLVGVGTMSNEWQTYNVYQYEYDYTLGCWCATENFVSQEVRIGSPSSGLNCALGNGKGLVYSNRDLYSGGFSVAYAESTEFLEEPFYGDDNLVVSPTPTLTITPVPSPTSIPSGGGSVVGGNSKPGSGLDFIVTMLAMFWTKICSIPMPVDGYEISIQQLYIYGIVAGIVGGIFFAFTRRK